MNNKKKAIELILFSLILSHLHTLLERVAEKKYIKGIEKSLQLVFLSFGYDYAFYCQEQKESLAIWTRILIFFFFSCHLNWLSVFLGGSEDLILL